MQFEQLGNVIELESLRKRRRKRDKYPFDIVQDSYLYKTEFHYYRRMFVSRLSKSYMKDVSTTNVPYKFVTLLDRNIFGQETKLLVASGPVETIAIRARGGFAGYSQWMNELQVYLLPRFKHKNILGFFGTNLEERGKIPSTRAVLSATRNGGRDCELSTKDNTKRKRRGQGRANEEEVNSNRITPPDEPTISARPTSKMEYWLLNDMSDCFTLKDYLRNFTLSWKQLLEISLGIVEGLDFLHRNSDFTFSTLDKRKAEEDFIRATNGKLKKCVFKDLGPVLYMNPYFNLSIIHRNLNSTNIMLKIMKDSQPIPKHGAPPPVNEDDPPLHLKSRLQAKIYNFGSSHIFFPFQPHQHRQYVTKEFKEFSLASAYSAPEVLMECSDTLTIKSMRAIDLYACGMIFYEMMGRCITPRLDEAEDWEHELRACPAPYKEPFELEFEKHLENNIQSRTNPGSRKIPPKMLQYAVCTKKQRPSMHWSWLIGRKTNLYCQIIMELWDENFDARVSAATCIERLNKLMRMNLLTDVRNNNIKQDFRTFQYEKHWPPKYYSGVFAPVYPFKSFANLEWAPLQDETESSSDEIDA